MTTKLKLALKTSFDLDEKDQMEVAARLIAEIFNIPEGEFNHAFFTRARVFNSMLYALNDRCSRIEDRLDGVGHDDPDGNDVSSLRPSTGLKAQMIELLDKHGSAEALQANEIDAEKFMELASAVETLTSEHVLCDRAFEVFGKVAVSCGAQRPEYVKRQYIEGRRSTRTQRTKKSLNDIVAALGK